MYMSRLCLASLVGIAAIVDDVSHRRISNWISVSALAGGLVLQLWEGGWRGGLASLLGALVGGSVFLIFYLLGGMGAGDIKLMAGFGSILGANGIIQATLWVAAFGGFLAVGFIVAGKLRHFWRRLLSKPALAPEVEAKSIPYAPAIAAGVWLSLLAR